MDGDPNPSETGEEGAAEGCEKKRPIGALLLRCAFSLIFSITASFLISFLFGLVAIALGALSSTGAVLVPAECKILSSGLDLRTSRQCGFSLSGKDASILYRLEKARVQCRDDYYWASIFKVEYKDFFSGRNFSAVAEAPREALPDDCRPNFNDVWMIKSRFKVNETYKCRYAPGTYRADILSDELFNCQAHTTYNMKKAKRFLNLVMSFCTYKPKGRHELLSMVVGIITGMFISLCLSITMRVVYVLKLSSSSSVLRQHLTYSALCLRRGCLIVAYISAMGWLTLQYSKVIGLKQLLFSSDLWDRLTAR